MTALMGNSVGFLYFRKQQRAGGHARRPREFICYQLRVIDAPLQPRRSHKAAHSCLAGRKPRLSSADWLF